MDDSIVGYEFKFSTYVPFTINDNDYHIVKERVHYKDGRTEPKLRIIKNFERDFYVTKEAYRNHEMKKDFEDIDKLQKYTCTQSQLTKRVQKALGLDYMQNVDLRYMSNNPYIYGIDIKTSSLIQYKYKQTYPDLFSESTVCAFDIETDVLNTGHNKEINIISASMADRIVCVVNEYFVESVQPPEKREEIIHAAIKKYLGEHINEDKVKVTIKIVKNELECIKETFKYIHEWMPDFVSIWNINYDLPYLISVCEKYGVRPADIFSDPSIPESLRYFKYKEGPSRKMKANGEVVSLKPADRWHVATCTSSFYFIDAMIIYRQLRLDAPEEQSYALDAILKKELGITKLKFTEADSYIGLAWHVYMQSTHPVEYVVYNIFDTFSMIKLEEKTKDLGQAINIFSNLSHLSDANSQPRRLVNALYFAALENNQVIGTAGSELKCEIDDLTLPLKGWTVALDPTYMVDNGIRCIKELPYLYTSIRLYNADLDIASAYPTNQCVFNTSRGTTKTELISISGIHKDIWTMQNINLISGEVNSVDYCKNMFSFPSLLELEQNFETLMD